MTDQIAIEGLSVEDFHSTANAIVGEVGKVIVGQEEGCALCVICVISGIHALLGGVPGLGKKILILYLADTWALRFPRTHFPPDLRPADVTGTNIMEENDEGRRAF